MTIQLFQTKKQQHEKISMLTCYDYPSACILAKTSIDAILVGDSVAMLVHGYESTVMATLDMLCMHTAAVARGLGRQFLISDMPFLAHRGSVDKLLDAASRLIHAGAMAIKIEGADEVTVRAIEHLIAAGIPVMGHLGLLPQTILAMGQYSQQGKQQAAAQKIYEDALLLQSLGCFAVVLECIPDDLAKRITQNLNIPSIGIGAGPATDGQILVWHDLLGQNLNYVPKFVKQYAHVADKMCQAIETYHDEVSSGQFPMQKHNIGVVS